MCTQNELKTLLENLVRIYRSVYGSSLDKVILYGSYARGDFTAESDVDVVAIVHGNRLELQNQLKRVWDQADDLSLEYELVLSPTVIPYEEFRAYQEDLPYYRNIAKEGVVISA